MSSFNRGYHRAGLPAANAPAAPSTSAAAPTAFAIAAAAGAAGLVFCGIRALQAGAHPAMECGGAFLWVAMTAAVAAAARILFGGSGWRPGLDAQTTVRASSMLRPLQATTKFARPATTSSIPPHAPSVAAAVSSTDLATRRGLGARTSAPRPLPVGGVGQRLSHAAASQATAAASAMRGRLRRVMSIPLRDGTSMDVMLPEVSSSSSAAAPRAGKRTVRQAMSVDGIGVGSGIGTRDVGATVPDTISEANPLRVVIAGAGVGGLALANALVGRKDVEVTVLESTSEFKRFGGPIQLASNAMSVLQSIDLGMYSKIEEVATYTGDKINGIKDGIRTDWYAKFDLATPARARSMQYTCVVERPDLQEIMLERVRGSVKNSSRVASYDQTDEGVAVTLEDGTVVHGDVLVGADGIWSAVRASMREEPAKGDGSGVSYSGYTVFAGELEYESADNGDVGYKVYIGPGQYFVITDIGKGRYQWYAFLARPAGSEAAEPKPLGQVPYLKDVFEGWSHEIHHILDATREDQCEQRDLYDRPPSVFKPWTDKRVTLLGDAVHAMMPNLGQGGCQAIEDAKVIAEELEAIKQRSKVPQALGEYRNRRLLRSATVQGLSRFASDIIIKGFDTPARVEVGKDGIKIENFNYQGIVTKLLQPVLPLFFSIQFNFLYSGWKNEPFNLEPIRDLFVIGPGVVAGGLAVDAVLGGEAFESVSATVDAITQAITDSGM